MKSVPQNVSESVRRRNPHLYAKNHNPPEGICPAEPERIAGSALDGPEPGKETGGNFTASRFEVRYYVRSRRPMDFDNICIKYLQDLLVEIGALPDDRWDVLQGKIQSDKAETAEEEGVIVTIEALPDKHIGMAAMI